MISYRSVALSSKRLINDMAPQPLPKMTILVLPKAPDAALSYIGKPSWGVAVTAGCSS